MVGDLLVSQVLTLFTTPVVYVYLDRLASYMAGRDSEQQRSQILEDPPKQMAPSLH